MGNVVPLHPRRSRKRQITTTRWQLVIEACQELYYSPDFKARRDTTTQTQRKILAILSRHFGSTDAAQVLDMILISYEIYYCQQLWKTLLNVDAGGMLAEISHLLALAHHQASTATVYSRYVEIKKKVLEYESRVSADLPLLPDS